MKLIDFLKTEPSGSDAEVAEAYNALPDHFDPIPSHIALGWIGSGGRLARIRKFISTHANSENQTLIDIRSAFELLLLAVSNPQAFIQVSPGSDHRNLLEAAVTVQALDQSDADALVSLALREGYELATEENVAVARVTLAHEEAVSRANITNTQSKLIADAINRRAKSVGDVAAVTLEAPITPEGFVFEQGELISIA